MERSLPILNVALSLYGKLNIVIESREEVESRHALHLEGQHKAFPTSGALLLSVMVMIAPLALIAVSILGNLH